MCGYVQVSSRKITTTTTRKEQKRLIYIVGEYYWLFFCSNLATKCLLWRVWRSKMTNESARGERSIQMVKLQAELVNCVSVSWYKAQKPVSMHLLTLILFHTHTHTHSSTASFSPSVCAMRFFLSFLSSTSICG